MSSDKENHNTVSVIGYGTFITRGYWKNKQNVQPCLIHNYSRVFPSNYWFPIVFPSNDSFWALKFDVSYEQLAQLDHYERVHLGIFERIQIEVELKMRNKIKAFLYIPTENFIVTNALTKELDTNDKWKEYIKSFPEIVQLFPELIL